MPNNLAFSNPCILLDQRRGLIIIGTFLSAIITVSSFFNHFDRGSRARTEKVYFPSALAKQSKEKRRGGGGGGTVAAAAARVLDKAVKEKAHSTRFRCPPPSIPCKVHFSLHHQQQAHTCMPHGRMGQRSSVACFALLPCWCWLLLSALLPLLLHCTALHTHTAVQHGPISILLFTAPNTPRKPCKCVLRSSTNMLPIVHASTRLPLKLPLLNPSFSFLPLSALAAAM